MKLCILKKMAESMFDELKAPLAIALVLAILLSGCSSSYGNSLRAVVKSWSQDAFMYGVLCERCDWYRSHPEDWSKRQKENMDKICAKYKEKPTLESFIERFERDWDESQHSF